jgi:hypothetical protein
LNDGVLDFNDFEGYKLDSEAEEGSINESIKS